MPSKRADMKSTSAGGFFFAFASLRPDVYCVGKTGEPVLLIQRRLPRHVEKLLGRLLVICTAVPPSNPPTPLLALLPTSAHERPLTVMFCLSNVMSPRPPRAAKTSCVIKVALGPPVGGQMMQPGPLSSTETTEVTVSTRLKGVDALLLHTEIWPHFILFFALVCMYFLVFYSSAAASNASVCTADVHFCCARISY